MQVICTLLQTDNDARTSSLNFYTSDALPDTNSFKALKASNNVQLTVYYLCVELNFNILFVYCVFVTDHFSGLD